jgi:5-methylcytosine-specific restriction endonuclease McrA
MSYGATQRFRIENRLCLTCAKQLPDKTKILFCADCANTNRKQRKTLVAARKELGLCVACGKNKPLTGGKCELCASRNAVYQRKAREQRLAQGMCSDCGKSPPLETMLRNEQYRLCEECYLQKISRVRLGSRKHWTVLRQKLIEQNYTCPYTGMPIVLGVNDSLDHIYPAQRYPELAHDPSNTEWVTREVNEMKRDRTPDEFLSLLQSILEYRLGRSQRGDAPRVEAPAC